MFDVNVPLGVLAVIAAALLLPDGAENPDTAADWPGLVLLSAALVALLTPLIQGQQEGRPPWTYASIAGAVALLARAFGHSATLAMAASAGLSVAAFALVFALPKRTPPNVGYEQSSRNR